MQWFPSKYVKSLDLGGKEITVAIDRVEIEKVGAPPRVEEKPVVYFRGAKKGLILNKVNAMTIAGLYTPETENWKGQRVILYPTLVDAFGKMNQVIRIRPEVPPAPKPGTAPVEETHFADSEDPGDDDLNDPTADPVEETPGPTQSNGKPPRKLGVATTVQLREINALISALVPKQDVDRTRHQRVKAVTKGATESSQDLTQAQANELIARLHAELSERIVLAVEDEDEMNRLLLTHNQRSLLEASPVALTHIWKEVQEKAQAEAVKEAA